MTVVRRTLEVPADMPLLGGRLALVDRSTPGQDASNEQM